MQSIFTRPRARPPLAAVSSQQNMLAVSTEDELLAALTSLPRSDGACYGRAINIVADITLTRTVTLGAQHSGLLITSSSNARISTKTVDVTPTFFVKNNANDVTVERMVLSTGFLSSVFVQSSGAINTSVKGISVVGITFPMTVLLLGTTSGASVSDCVSDLASSSTASIISIAAAVATVFSVCGNKQFAGTVSLSNGQLGIISSNSFLGPISAVGTVRNNVISGNTMAGNITMQASTGNNVISGNCMNSYNITTSAGIGGNSIVGNTNVGTITNASTDAVTSNT